MDLTRFITITSVRQILPEVVEKIRDFARQRPMSDKAIAVSPDTPHPFWVMVRKEIADHIRSWRFIVIASLIVLICLTSLYTGVSNMSEAAKANEHDPFFFLFLFTATDGTLPSYLVFVSFLAPLLGVSLGFDAINSEQNRGTLGRLLAQPIHRDYLLNAKFLGALLVIGVMLFALGFLMIGAGLIRVGIPPSAEEFWRVVFFTMITVFYVGFWLNLSIFF
jgi:ABC-2 type transport system permease protein